MVVTHPVPDLEYFLYRLPLLPCCGLSRYFFACKYSDCGLDLMCWDMGDARARSLVGVVTPPCFNCSRRAPTLTNIFLRTYLDIFRPANILTVSSSSCLGTCSMHVQGARRAWPRCLDAKVVVGALSLCLTGGRHVHEWAGEKTFCFANKNGSHGSPECDQNVRRLLN